MKKLFFTLLLSCCFFSCEEIKREFEVITSGQKSLNIVCLVDFSGSIPVSTIKWYKDVISGTIINYLDEIDKISVLPVDYGSLTSSVEIFNIDFSEGSFTKELDSPAQADKLKEKRLNEFREAQLLRFSETFEKSWQDRKAFARGTDIVGGIKQSLKYFNTEKEICFLVIFSDMINETEKLNHARLLNSTKDIPKLFDVAEKIDLAGINVFVMTGEQPKVSLTKFDLLKEFWMTYLSGYNGKILDYSSGGESVLLSHLRSVKN